MQLDLRGRVAVIAGGSDGIGLATASGLVRAGAEVVIIGRRESRLMKAKALFTGRPEADRITVMQADVTSARNLTTIIAETTERWGRTDILVSAVGKGVRSTLESGTERMWEKNWRTNVLSAVTVVRAFRGLLKVSRQASVILLGAASGLVPTQGQLISNVHKAAVIGLGQSLALELAPEGIRVNVVCPGKVLTRRRLARANKQASEEGRTVEEHLAEISQRIPLGAWGDPEDVADLIVFLSSDSGRYISGQVIAVDGGLTQVRPK